MRHIPRTAAVLAALAAATLALSGCSASFEGASDSGGTGQQAPQAVDGESRGAADEAASPEDRALVITGTVTVTAEDPIAAAALATEIAASVGGRVDARTEYAARDGEGGSARLTLRVPADSVDEVRERLDELGTVDQTDFSTVSVGERQRDIESRITTLTASIARFTAWLATAETTADLISLETAIADRQAQLETLEAEQRALADQVAMSTITLTLRAEGVAPPPEGPTNFWEGLVAGWNAFVGFWAGVAVGLGVALPWLVLLAVGVVAAVYVARRVGRGAAPTAAPPGAPMPPAPPAAS
ncbi:DUF4349 domain-containing protein [Protaetiibacter sp. SSC-01]|uniref:DUF4349 domain-containing protein n=1 Tax=Protaetiibacter sp. SSC-01 TaxID=2759943 RepID=UPI001656AE40|nr:DUF4349 domain-containing protein [Protaetiibacter sp. SSC-01]QNO38031.1 DUF4349 domain-containing protein [Protaetiibacter sp. SSC-01]